MDYSGLKSHLGWVKKLGEQVEEAHSNRSHFSGGCLSINISPVLEAASLLEAPGSDRPRVSKPRKRHLRTAPRNPPSVPRPTSPGQPLSTPRSATSSDSLSASGLTHFSEHLRILCRLPGHLLPGILHWLSGLPALRNPPLAPG